MIISHTHRAIFVHVPKTAGTSITAWMEPSLRWNDLVLGGTEFGERVQPAYRERFGLSKHMEVGYKASKKLFARDKFGVWKFCDEDDIRRIIGAGVWGEFFSVAFVRHPYTRLVSFYNWQRAAIGRAAPDAPLWSWPSIQAHLRSGSFSELIRDEQFLGSLAGRPQADWVCDEEDRCIVDFVGRFEDLAAGIRTVADRIGLPVAVLGTLNTTPADRPLGGHFGGESDYELIHDLHRRDFEMFGYDPAVRL